MTTNSPYDSYNNQIGVRLSFVVSDPDKASENSAAFCSYDTLAKRAKRNPGFRLKEGKGAGNEALINWAALPNEWKDVLVEKFGEPQKAYNPLRKHFTVSAEAKRFFDYYQLPGGEYLSQKHREQFTINASVLDAVKALKIERTSVRRSRQGTLKGLWASMVKDAVAFQDHLKEMGLCQHTLPSSEKRFRMWFNGYESAGFEALIDGRIKNTNAQTVTPEMIELWQAIFAGQRNYKATYIEVALRYKDFLAGKIDILNTGTGELYDPQAGCYNPASESTVYNYQTLWENKASSFSNRSGDRQRFKSDFDPYHKLGKPKYAGSIISIDDRQPPFQYEENGKKKRMWFYMGIDLGSEAWTTWVWGASKEGIIHDFYRQMVRNYFMWGKSIPYELECEMSLNSTYQNTLLQNGAMFQQVRIEANNARGKRIERYFGSLRYGPEKSQDGWVARPSARKESNQLPAGKVPTLPKSQIVENALKVIEDWNNQLHSDQDVHPGMSRWDVFMDKQLPNLSPTNWIGILPYIGYKQSSSMKAGRITLQGKSRVVGRDGKPALGESLIQIMKQIEGENVVIYWLDDNEGRVMKALVFTESGRYVSELLSDHECNGDLEYQRATAEQTEQDHENRKLMSAYANTVQSFISKNAKAIESVAILKKPEVAAPKRFVMPGVRSYTPSDSPAETLPDQSPIPDSVYTKSFSTSTKDRF